MILASFVDFLRARKHRRARFAAAVVLFLSCATVRHVDEAQVRTLAAQRLDCDEAFVRIVAESSPAKGVARYAIEGCARKAEYDCTEHAHVVSCESTDSVAKNEVTPPSDTEVTTNDYDTSGCNCGHLFDSHSSSPANSPQQNVMPSTPQTNPQHR